jgi:hypothetical protein
MGLLYIFVHVIQFQPVARSFCSDQTVETCSGIQPFFHSLGIERYVSKEKSGGCVKPKTRIHTVQGLRVHGANLHSMWCLGTEKNLPFKLLDDSEKNIKKE